MIKTCLCGCFMELKWSYSDSERIQPSEEEWYCESCGNKYYNNEAYGYQWFDKDGYEINEEVYYYTDKEMDETEEDDNEQIKM